MRRRNLSGFAEASDGKGCVEVLSHLRNYPMIDGPGVDPRDGTSIIAAFHEHSGSKGGNGLRNELEIIIGLRSSEQSHQELVGRWTMEPPIEVWGHKLVHSVHVA